MPGRRMDEPGEPLRCSECKQKPREERAPRRVARRVRRHERGGLHIFCPEC